MKKQTKTTARATKKAAPKKVAAKAQKKTRLAIPRRGQVGVSFTEVRKRVAAALNVPAAAPVPDPVPVPPVARPPLRMAGGGQIGIGAIHKPTDQTWRTKIDWVAAGKKAHETRMRNLAALQSIAAGHTIPPVAVAPPVPVTPGPKRVTTAPPAPAAKEEHTSISTPSRPRIVSRGTAAPRRSTTSRSSAGTRR